jgi:hypothetical protein
MDLSTIPRVRRDQKHPTLKGHHQRVSAPSCCKKCDIRLTARYSSARQRADGHTHGLSCQLLRFAQHRLLHILRLATQQVNPQPSGSTPREGFVTAHYQDNLRDNTVRHTVRTGMIRSSKTMLAR